MTSQHKNFTMVTPATTGTSYSRTCRHWCPTMLGPRGWTGEGSKVGVIDSGNGHGPKSLQIP